MKPIASPGGPRVRTAGHPVAAVAGSTRAAPDACPTALHQSAPHAAAPERAPGRPRQVRTALVIGAGIGGLAAPGPPAAKGYAVTVLGRHGTPGGGAGVWRSEGFTFDTGPSLVMMVEYWQKLFRDVGRRFEDYVTLVQIDPCYRVHFPDGTSHEQTSTLNRLIESCERIEPGCTPRLLAYLGRAGRMYADGLRFIGRNLYRATDMLSIPHLRMLGGAGALGDLQRMMGKYFADERL